MHRLFASIFLAVGIGLIASAYVAPQIYNSIPSVPFAVFCDYSVSPSQRCPGNTGPPPLLTNTQIIVTLWNCPTYSCSVLPTSNPTAMQGTTDAKGNLFLQIPQTTNGQGLGYYACSPAQSLIPHLTPMTVGPRYTVSATGPNGPISGWFPTGQTVFCSGGTQGDSSVPVFPANQTVTLQPPLPATQSYNVRIIFSASGTSGSSGTPPVQPSGNLPSNPSSNRFWIPVVTIAGIAFAAGGVIVWVKPHKKARA
jgi:hypothetical protein